MRRLRDRPVLPPPEELRATAVHFLRQGDEQDEADVLSACVLEITEPRPIDDLDAYVVSIALRAERKVVERLQVNGHPDQPASPLMKRLRSALTVALPCGFGLGRLEVRAAAPGVIPGPTPQVSPPPVPPPPPPPPSTGNVFCLQGANWLVRFNGHAEFRLPNTLGARYIGYLLHHPRVPIGAFKLETAVHPERSEIRSGTTIQEQSDPKAVAAYLRELDELRRERDAAEDACDTGLIDRLDAEIAALEAKCPNRPCAADTGERARNNVRHAIRTVHRKLRLGSQAERSFAAHIEQYISLGFKCIYNQPFAEDWA